MSSDFDISTLSIKDFSLQIYASVCAQLKEVTSEKIKGTIKKVVQERIVEGLIILNKDNEEIHKEITNVMQTNECKKLIDKIYDMVMEMKFKCFIPVEPATEEGDFLLLSPRTTAELEESLLMDDEKEHQRCNTPVCGKSTNVIATEEP